MATLCKDDVGWGRKGKNNPYNLESKPSHYDVVASLGEENKTSR